MEIPDECLHFIRCGPSAALIQRTDEYRQSVGIVVGIVEPTGRRIVAYSALAKDDQRPLNGDTVFEIGSITKVFTALLLTDLVEHGEVAFTDPVSKYLPTQVTAPHRGGRQITLQDLATHRSGLPRLPANFKPKDPSNPYMDYTLEQLYQFLSTYELPRDVDSQVEYSNLGFGLLGHALERRAGMDYESLVRMRILDPLGMSSTRIVLSTDMQTRFASGHNAKLERVGNWDVPTLAGAGALRSTANDMLTFLGSNLGYIASPVSRAMTAMLHVRRSIGREIAIGWHSVTLDGIFAPDGRHIVWHDGGTAGYSAFIGFDPKVGTGVVVLANASSVSAALSGIANVHDIGLHLLDARFPLNQRHNHQP
jgi:serine-type D-Ala-D-Ala carboxypeptidase/endopeptidase